MTPHRLSSKVVVTLSILALAILAVLTIQATVKPTARHATALPSLKIAVAEAPTALIFYALKRGFFAAEDIDVELVPFPNGVLASQALHAGEVDMATASAWVIAKSAFDHPELRIVSQIGTFVFSAIIGRRDRGIATEADLSGKRIALVGGTVHDLLLPRFLSAVGVSPDTVTLVAMGADEIPGALEEGTADAVLTWQPFIDRIHADCAGNCVEFPVNRDAVAVALLATQEDVLSEKAQGVEAVLSALVEADRRIKSEPEDFERLLVDTYGAGYGPGGRQHNTIFPFAGLRQSLLVLLDERARVAAQARSETADDAPELPDFLEIVETGPIKAVAPTVVSVID